MVAFVEIVVVEPEFHFGVKSIILDSFVRLHRGARFDFYRLLFMLSGVFVTAGNFFTILFIGAIWTIDRAFGTFNFPFLLEKFRFSDRFRF
jgi:hypothetical protein